MSRTITWWEVDWVDRIQPEFGGVVDISINGCKIPKRFETFDDAEREAYTLRHRQRCTVVKWVATVVGETVMLHDPKDK